MNAELLAAVKALPRSEKVRLITEVWASLDDSFDPPLSAAQEAELTRRVESFAANPHDTVSWEDVKANGRKKLMETKRAKR